MALPNLLLGKMDNDICRLRNRCRSNAAELAEIALPTGQPILQTAAEPSQGCNAAFSQRVCRHNDRQRVEATKTVRARAPERRLNANAGDAALVPEVGIPKHRARPCRAR